MSTEDFSNADLRSLFALRQGGLVGIARMTEARDASLRRGLAFARARHGDDGRIDGLAKAAEEQSKLLATALAAEVEHTRLEVPEVDESVMGVSGRVTRSGEPVDALTIGAYSSEGKLVGKGCTGEGGRFVLEIGQETPIRLSVFDANGKECYSDREERPFLAGDSLFVEIDLGAEGRCADPPDTRPPDEKAIVPELGGKPLKEAQALLDRAGLVLGKQERRSDADRDGVVLDQSPKPGTSLKPGDAVDIVVSAKPETGRAVPALVGLGIAEAVDTLARAGYQQTELAAKRSDKAAVVIDQKPPAGKEADPSITVALVVAISGDMKADAPALAAFYDAEPSRTAGKLAGAALFDRLIAKRIVSYDRLAEWLAAKDEEFGTPLGIIDAGRLKAIRATVEAVLKRVKRAL